jgi:transposase-like protein
MKYENIKDYPDAKFRRISGMKIKTFQKALEILNAKYAEEHSKNVRGSGRKPKLTMEDKLLATLEYLREYRTLAHIAASYGIDESNIWRIVRWVEDTLIKDGTFRLPGKKELLKSDSEIEVVQIDVTESPVERPKRGRKIATQVRKSDTH